MLSTEGLLNLHKAARTTQRIDPWQAQSPITRRALEKWESLRGSRLYPARKDITPKELGSLLRNIALVRVIGQAKDFEFRILGDAVVQSGAGIEAGTTTSELERKIPGYGKIFHAIYKNVCDKPSPRAYRGFFERNDGEAFFHESLLLPLGNHASAVDHILVVGIYAPLPR